MKFRYFFSGILFVFVLIGQAQAWDFNHVSFKKADSLAMANRGASLDDLPELVYNLTNSLETDAERFRAIYLWVCTNVKNDYGLYAKNKRKRKRYQDDSLKLEAWNEKFKKRIFKTLLKRKRTICTGYAYMVKTLSQLVNIDCKIINGFAKTSSGNPEDLRYPNHSWNAVKLDGKWYLSDPTWASGVQNLDNGRFKFDYNNGLFLAPPRLFAINHFPLEAEWFLFNDAQPTFTDFLEAPIVYNEAYKLLTEHKTPQKLYNEVPRNYTMNLECLLKPNINPKKISLDIDDGVSNKTVVPDNYIIKNQILYVKHNLTKYGFYDIHLSIDDQLVASYVYKVKRFSEN
ncbi:transglutaminase domain-containing protein [Winogradskyella haliclonae]|uniref:Transglutaminase-like domain-containing protein n=1 Tax=Winogradskyella haliclonae TaxID=2048558 RepID=A0ABQ2BVX2_9FLAO|nr:transglutaminase domain-containing protein [Winogradskyella haliclonae]GGI56651.1 hypothetical protein GCM10011444_09600 [Winogradskyella haliclonae]